MLLGPKAMEKLFSIDGEVMITNDGATAIQHMVGIL